MFHCQLGCVRNNCHDAQKPRSGHRQSQFEVTFGLLYTTLAAGNLKSSLSPIAFSCQLLCTHRIAKYHKTRLDRLNCVGLCKKSCLHCALQRVSFHNQVYKDCLLVWNSSFTYMYFCRLIYWNNLCINLFNDLDTLNLINAC